MSSGVREGTEGRAVQIAAFAKKRFLSLPLNLTPPTAVPPSVRNKSFNRSMEHLPNPATRVVLSAQTDMDFDIYTYINANFVRGPSGNPREYIVAMA